MQKSDAAHVQFGGCTGVGGKAVKIEDTRPPDALAPFSAALDDLRKDCDVVIAGGLSTGAVLALMLAAKEGNLDTVLVLLERGAAVNLRNLAGATALGLALEAKRNDVAGVLVRAGAEQ